MEPEGLTILVLAMSFFVFIYAMYRSKYSHELKKLDKIAHESADRSLTTGELEQLVRGIVSDMTSPLQDRVDELSRRLEAAPKVPLLDSESEEKQDSGREKTVGRRTRV